MLDISFWCALESEAVTHNHFHSQYMYYCSDLFLLYDWLYWTRQQQSWVALGTGWGYRHYEAAHTYMLWVKRSCTTRPIPNGSIPATGNQGTAGTVRCTPRQYLVMDILIWVECYLIMASVLRRRYPTGFKDGTSHSSKEPRLGKRGLVLYNEVFVGHTWALLCCKHCEWISSHWKLPGLRPAISMIASLQHAANAIWFSRALLQI